MNRHCLMTLTEGRVVRDLLENGLLDFLNEGGLRVTIVTPADRVPAFVNRWKREGARFVHLLQPREHRWLARAVKLRKRLASGKWTRFWLDSWLRFERRGLFAVRPEYERLFNQNRPDLVVATNATPPAESEFLCHARRHDICTLGIVGSWDRLHKFLYGRSEHLSVWNDLNQQEAVSLEGYRPEQVHVTGPAQFDAYFSSDAVWSRETTCSRAGLDSSKPYIFFATAGCFIPNYDETYLLEWLLAQIDNGALPANLQVLCRLHPFSHLEHFVSCAQNSRVTLSFMGYIPTLGASMTREDVVAFGNLIRHAAMVVTPGSTLTIEAAIFDTPTLIPVFHTYQAEQCEQYYRTRVFGRHFARIRKLRLVPIVSGRDELLAGLRRCLSQREWYRDERARLVQDYVQFTDGQSTRRLADLILQLANALLSPATLPRKPAFIACEPQPVSVSCHE